MQSNNKMVLGGTDDSGKILSIEAIKRLPPNTKIGGKWKIYQCERKILPGKARTLLLSLHLLDTMQYNEARIDIHKLLECKIWKHPNTKPIPKKNDIIVVQGQNAKTKSFNQSIQINIPHEYAEYIRSDPYNRRQITTHQSSRHSSSEYSDSHKPKTNPIRKNSNAKTHRLSAKNIAKHNERMNRIQHKHNPMQMRVPVDESAFIKQTIQHLFAWTVHHFPSFNHLSSQWQNCSTPPSNSFSHGSNAFLGLLIDGMTRDDLQLKDPIDLYGRNGDAILDEMWLNIRSKTKQLLKEERYSELTLFTKIILQRVNGIIVKKDMNQRDKYKYDERKLREKYDKFPLKKEFEKFPSVVVYHILHSSLQIGRRSDHALKAEQRGYKPSGNKVEYTEQYAKYLMKCLCVLCFNSNVVLKYHLNIGIDGSTSTHICNECSEKIGYATFYWKLYESMLHWDNGWKLLLSKECDQKYRCAVGVMCAMLFRDAFYKTNL